MTDANKYYLDKREAEQEEYDFKDEYEEIAADNVRLEAEVKKYHDAWLEAEAQVVELEAQVAKGLKALVLADALLSGANMNRQVVCRAMTEAIAELKGEQDE